MAITVICSCGARYDLKDELFGKLVECPKCHAQMYATGQRQVLSALERPEIGDPIFDRDKFLLRQKHFAIAEKYYIWDDKGNKLLYVERPTYHFRNLLAVLGGILAAIIVGIIFGMIASFAKSGVLAGFLWLFTILTALTTLFVVAVILYKKRPVHFYRDDTKRDLILNILQDNKIQMVNAYYTIVDVQGKTLARLRKNYLYNMFRRRWFGYSPDGLLLFIAREDSLILSLLRRFLGNFFGILRINFEILDKDGNRLGAFNRKMTILDRYVLDMAADYNKTLDRRIAIALGVMLDTGERR